MDPDERGRLPKRWNSLVSKWRTRNHPLFLRVHRGFFLSMGVEGWKRFTEVMLLTIRDPEFVREAMRIQGEFSARIAERALKDAEFDAAVFTEPIAENRGPLIPRKMYEDLVLKSYEPVLAVLRRYRVNTVSSYLGQYPVSPPEHCEKGIQLPLGLRSASEGDGLSRVASRIRP